MPSGEKKRRALKKKKKKQEAIGAITNNKDFNSHDGRGTDPNTINATYQEAGDNSIVEIADAVDSVKQHCDEIKKKLRRKETMSSEEIKKESKRVFYLVVDQLCECEPHG